MSCKTVGLIIIGDEILKGQTLDTNSVYVCKKLHSIGLPVVKMCVVRDRVEDIAEEVAIFSNTYDIVVTSGGVGPTHDDVTYDGVARAFDQRLIQHEEMLKTVSAYLPLVDGCSKMARIPAGAELLPVTGERGGCDQSFPIVKVNNVYILPGVPEFFRRSFDHLLGLFRRYANSNYQMSLLVNAGEFHILDQLNACVRKYESEVDFGSYPVLTLSGSYHTKLCLESGSVERLVQAYKELKSNLPVTYVERPLDTFDSECVYSMRDGMESHCRAVASSIQMIEEALLKYPPDSVYLCFNGGKDCTVLVHLLWCVLRRASVDDTTRLHINTVYIRCDNPFCEVETFIRACCDRYNLDLTTVDGPIKSALEKLTRDKPQLEAVFMGTRRTDPHSQNLQHFQLCDPSWPQIMRINPLLDWSYSDVWMFLRLLDVPYCELYDRGYTSLGNVNNTKPNPALNVNGDGVYEPAYKLSDGGLERQGRG